MQKTLAVVALLSVLAAPAFAADLPNTKGPPVYAPPPPPALFTWTGAYVGAQVGGAWNSSSFNDSIDPNAPVPPIEFRSNGAGVVAGGHIGYNYQISQFVLGVEGSFNYVGVNSASDAPGYIYSPASVETRQHWLGSAGVRLGYAVDRVLLYVDGGAAFTHYGISDSASLIGTPYNAQYGGGSRVGWTVGAGVEYALTNNWIIGVDYKYYDFGAHNIQDGFNDPDSDNLGGPGLDFFHVHPTENSVTARISYKFDFFAPPAPVVAKY